MIEIGLMFYSRKITKDLEAAVKRFEVRMECKPNTIYIKKGCLVITNLKVKFTALPKNHFVLAME
jgi:hypothetical protein